MSKRGLTKIRSGHFRRAMTDGIAERTPKRRASYEAAATTPRSRAPPTTTSLPRRSGLSRCSTDAKNASMSMWITLRWRSSSREPSEPGAGEGRGVPKRDKQRALAWTRSGCEVARFILSVAPGHDPECVIRQRALELQGHLGVRCSPRVDLVLGGQDHRHGLGVDRRDLRISFRGQEAEKAVLHLTLSL